MDTGQKIYKHKIYIPTTIETIESNIRNIAKNLDNEIDQLQKHESNFLINFLVNNYNKLIQKKFFDNIRDDFYLELNSLGLAVKSLIDDIYRYTIYSSSEKAEDVKYGAYLIKWISRIKPIQIKHTTTNITKHHLAINSYFAIFTGIAIIKLNNSENENLKKILPELRYATIYRDINPKDLTLLLRTLKNQDKQKTNK